MNAAYAEVNFDEDEEFELPVRLAREALAGKFAELKENLLSERIDQADSFLLQVRLKHAANEAAGLAWTTEYPLLVFPELFDELASRESVRNKRQQRIIAETESLLAVH